MSISFCLSELWQPLSSRMFPKTKTLLSLGMEGKKLTTNLWGAYLVTIYLPDSHYGRTQQENWWNPRES